MTETRPAMVEVRSADGKLLCRVTADFRRLEIVRRGVRYTVALPGMVTGGVIFVSEMVEEHEEDGKEGIQKR